MEWLSGCFLRYPVLGLEMSILGGLVCAVNDGGDEQPDDGQGCADEKDAALTEGGEGADGDDGPDTMEPTRRVFM
jgi:hypothetical protein